MQGASELQEFALERRFGGSGYMAVKRFHLKAVSFERGATCSKLARDGCVVELGSAAFACRVPSRVARVLLCWCRGSFAAVVVGLACVTA